VVVQKREGEVYVSIISEFFTEIFAMFRYNVMGRSIMNPTFNEQINFLRSTGREAKIFPLLAKYITANPQDAHGWYELSKYVEQKERSLDSLERARTKPTGNAFW
jgi:hypothetical protein